MTPPAPANPLTTSAAEGLPRRAWTVADVQRMVETGLIGDHERIELIGGEIVPMSPKGIQHELIKRALLKAWYRTAPEDITLIPETTLRLSNDTYLEPDIVVYREADGLANLRGETALLVVEIAESSLAYDRGRKAQLYAQFGIRELWVIDAAKLVTRLYREPGADGYRVIRDALSADEIAPAAVPQLTLTIAKLDLR